MIPLPVALDFTPRSLSSLSIAYAVLGCLLVQNHGPWSMLAGEAALRPDLPRCQLGKLTRLTNHGIKIQQQFFNYYDSRLFWFSQPQRIDQSRRPRLCMHHPLF